MKFTDRARRGITRFVPEDRSALIDFQRRMFGDDARQIDAERFRWLFDRNPSRSHEGPGLWLCRRNGAVVGQQAEIPFNLLVGTETRRAAWAIDLMVDPNWRLRGVGPALTDAQLGANEIVAAVTLSDVAYRSYVRSGWTDLGIVPTYLRPLDLHRVLGVAGPRRRRLRAVSLVLGCALKVDELALRLAATVSQLSLVEVESFDDRADRLWSDASRSYCVIRRRDAATLQWFFDERPDRSTYRRFYLQRGDRVLGYAVVRLRSENAGPTAVVADYLARPARVPVMMALLLEHLRGEAVAVRMRTLNRRTRGILALAGFVRVDRGTPRPLHLLVSANIDAPAVRARLTDRANWFFTSGDTDLETDIHGRGSRQLRATPTCEGA